MGETLIRKQDYHNRESTVISEIFKFLKIKQKSVIW